ncbi:unnamed protein product [Schistocephalus solidus]|uniref:Reverse transcriptase domain-containing protein n=1 Tax=Schistocephalus solidus TaxID=70667 RepID=A0A183SJW2_SCHSO|nr:unnamed protein product [Schistocephalus solidus]
MLLGPPLTGTQLSPVAPRSKVFPSGHTRCNHHDRRAKPGEGLRYDSRTSQIPPGDLSAPLVETLTLFGLYPRPEARSTGRAGDKGDPRCPWMDGSPPLHLQDEASSATTLEIPSHQCSARREEQDAQSYVDLPTATNKTTFYRCCRLVQQRLWEMQDALMTRKAEIIQGYMDRNEWKNFFVTIKAVYRRPVKGTAPLLSTDCGTLLPDKMQILTRWAEHFRSVLNQPSTISEAAIDRLPKVEINADLDLSSSLQETIRTTQQHSSGQAPASDAIATEVHKYGGPQMINQLTAIFQEMWHLGQVPQDFKDATIVHPDKKKGNHQLFDNHLGISLLNIAGNIFARILLDLLKAHLEQGLLPESQSGFQLPR